MFLGGLDLLVFINNLQPVLNNKSDWGLMEEQSEKQQALGFHKNIVIINLLTYYYLRI